MKKCKNDKQQQYLHKSFKMLMSSNKSESNQENKSNDEKIVGMGTLFKAFALFPKTLAGIIEKRGGAPSGFKICNIKPTANN